MSNRQEALNKLSEAESEVFKAEKAAKHEATRAWVAGERLHIGNSWELSRYSSESLMNVVSNILHELDQRYSNEQAITLRSSGWRLERLARPTTRVNDHTHKD